MTTHTPGPWDYEDGVVTADPIYSDRRAVIAQMIGERGLNAYGSLEERQSIADANGRLIAAAPQLLEALRAIMVEVDYHASHSGWAGNGGRDKARAALAMVQSGDAS